MPRFLKQVNFPKIVTVLAVTFAVALGACGLTVLASSHGGGEYAMPLAILELAVMVLAAVGLIVTVVVWVVASAFGNLSSKGSETQRLFEKDIDDDQRKD
jgi:Na+-driven multidrug efflux pump